MAYCRGAANRFCIDEIHTKKNSLNDLYTCRYCAVRLICRPIKLDCFSVYIFEFLKNSSKIRFSTWVGELPYKHLQFSWKKKWLESGMKYSFSESFFNCIYAFKEKIIKNPHLL